MTHIVVLAPGDDLELHWQQPGLQPTISERVREPRAAADVITLGDRLRFSVDLLRDFCDRPRRQSVLVELDRILRDADGTVTLRLKAADRQDPP